MTRDKLLGLNWSFSKRIFVRDAGLIQVGVLICLAVLVMMQLGY